LGLCQLVVEIQLIPIDAVRFSWCAVALIAFCSLFYSAFRRRKERSENQTYIAGVVLGQAKQRPSAVDIIAVLAVSKANFRVWQTVITTENGHVKGKILVCVKDKGHMRQKAPAKPALL